MSSHAHTGGSLCMRRWRSPAGFIRKYIFSTDHKVIGIQYFLLALTAVVVGIVLSLLMRFHLVWPQRDFAVRQRRADDAGAVSGAGDHARHDHGFLRADHRAAERLRQLFSADSNRRAGYGFSAAEHAVVLGDVSGVRCA